jgi:periplasmic divalent cation tolerance protein
MTGFVTVYVTTGGPEEAAEIGRALVQARLAACANVLGGLNSIYVWDGAVEESAEAALLLKTRASLVPEVTDWIKKMHEYSCPCIVAWPIAGGNQDYLDWIERETRAPGEGQT